MVRFFKKCDTEKNCELSEIEAGCWVYMQNPSREEIIEIATATSVPEHFFMSVMDEEEQARLESENGCSLTIVDIPKEIERDGKRVIETLPMALITTSEHLITVCTRRTSILDDFINSKIYHFDTFKQNKLMYQILYNTFTRYLFYLKRIDKIANNLQKNMSKTMENKELLELVELQKSLVFFSASLAANHAVVQKIINYNANKATFEEKEILDDALIEVRQAIEMCGIYREIIKNSMDAFSSIVNNNMNSVMKFLAAVTIILSIPMIISGYWGMNTGVPWEGLDYGFSFAIGISILFTVLTCIYFVKKKML